MFFIFWFGWAPGKCTLVVYRRVKRCQKVFLGVCAGIFVEFHGRFGWFQKYLCRLPQQGCCFMVKRIGEVEKQRMW